MRNTATPLDILALHREACRIIPAYAEVAKARTAADLFIRQSIDDIPVTDKSALFAGDLTSHLFRPTSATIGHLSSGSSGKPTVWFRGTKHKRNGSEAYDRILKRIFQIPPHESTLVVVCFSMGMWVAGTYTLLAFESIADTFPGGLSIVTPGIDLDDTLIVLRDIAPCFDHVVLAGYPGYIDLLTARLLKHAAPIPQRLHLITSGDKSSEAWRHSTMQALGIPRTASIVNVYGSSDAGILAHETPLTIAIRRRALVDSELASEVFGGAHPACQPALFQYDPSRLHFEQLGGELVLSADVDLPLLRYNIHDAGQVFGYEEMMAILGSRHAADVADWRFPFVTVSHRNDVALPYFGLKIPLDQLRSGLVGSDVADHLSGGFIAHTTSHPADTAEQLLLDLELSQGTLASAVMDRAEISRRIHERLVELNSEYRKLSSMLGQARVQPEVRLHPCGSLEHLTKCLQSPAIYAQAGKKPRMLMSPA